MREITDGNSPHDKGGQHLLTKSTLKTWAVLSTKPWPGLAFSLGRNSCERWSGGIFTHAAFESEMGCSPFSKRKGTDEHGFIVRTPSLASDRGSIISPHPAFLKHVGFSTSWASLVTVRFTNCFTIRKLFAYAFLFIYQDENPVKLVLMLFPSWRQGHGLWELQELVHGLAGGQCPITLQNAIHWAWPLVSFGGLGSIQRNITARCVLLLKHRVACVSPFLCCCCCFSSVQCSMSYCIPLGENKSPY